MSAFKKQKKTNCILSLHEDAIFQLQQAQTRLLNVLLVLRRHRGQRKQTNKLPPLAVCHEITAIYCFIHFCMSQSVNNFVAR